MDLGKTTAVNCQFLLESDIFSPQVHPNTGHDRFRVMIESMTGFATLDFQLDGYELNISLRSVNSRYLETRVRLPASLTYYDGIFKDAIKKRVARGKVDIEVNMGSSPEGLESVQIDNAAVAGVHKELTVLKTELGLSGEVSLETLARVMGNQMFRHQLNKSTVDKTLTVIMQAIGLGLDKLVDSRQNEGKVLHADLSSGLTNLSTIVDQVQESTSGLAEIFRARLNKKIAELNAQILEEDRRARVEMEVTVLAEKLDIHEELVRLRAHIESVDDTLNNTEDSCGKRLDFLLQEIIREINTVGSKVPDAHTRGLVVDMKTCVEMLRQQVANVA
jgi:uncharacterized protein (TIGR00255 family)